MVRAKRGAKRVARQMRVNSKNNMDPRAAFGTARAASHAQVRPVRRKCATSAGIMDAARVSSFKSLRTPLLLDHEALSQLEVITGRETCTGYAMQETDDCAWHDLKIATRTTKVVSLPRLPLAPITDKSEPEGAPKP